MDCNSTTLAYVVKGALEYARRPDWPDLCARYNGEIGLMAALPRVAEAIDSIWDDELSGRDDEFSGVWAYDVVEPVATWAVGEAIRAGELPDDEAIRQRTRDTAAPFLTAAGDDKGRTDLPVIRLPEAGFSGFCDVYTAECRTLPGGTVVPVRGGERGEFFSVYLRSPDGLSQWVADLATSAETETFADLCRGWIKDAS